MAYPKHDAKVRAEALRLYSNVGLNEAARRLEGICSRNTIQRWAKEAGAKSPTLEQRRKRHLNRRNIYLKARRIRLNDRLFSRIERMLKQKGDKLTANELRSLVISYAVLTDKRRTEEGENDVPSVQLTPEQIYEEGERRMLQMERQYGKPDRKALVSDIEEERRTRRAQNGAS